jgi:peptidoglycan/LPS O-acetylase OafA/YrhL
VLDGLRGLATVIVIATHLGQYLWNDIANWLFYPGGVVGVDVFFALSGFLITALMLGELDKRGRVNLGAFLWRRVLRLSPTLIVVVAAVLLATVAGLTEHDPLVQAKKSVWTVLYLQTWVPVEHMPQPELTQTWSLAVEMHFYLLWSALVAGVALVWPRRARPLLAVVGVAIVAVVVVMRSARYGEGQPPMLLYFNTPNRLDAPLVGCLGGLAYASGWCSRLSQRASAALTLAGLAGVGWVALTVNPFDGWLYRGGFTFAAAAGTLAVVGGAGLVRGPVFRALTVRPLAGLGLCSYSVYLWHLPVFSYLYRETPTWYPPARAAVGLAVTAALAAITYLGVERPVMRRRRAPVKALPLVIQAAEVTVDAGGGAAAVAAGN